MAKNYFSDLSGKSLGTSGDYTPASNYSITTTPVTSGQKISRYSLDIVGKIGNVINVPFKAVKSTISKAVSPLAGVAAMIDPVTRKQLGTWGAFKAGTSGGYQFGKDIMQSDMAGAISKGLKTGSQGSTTKFARGIVDNPYGAMGVDILSDPLAFAGLGKVTKPVAETFKGLGMVGRGEQITGDLSKGVRSLRRGESLAMPEIKAAEGTVPKLLNKFSPQIQKASKVIYDVRKAVQGEHDVVEAAIGVDRAAALKEAGLYDKTVDFLQRGAIEKGQARTSQSVKSYIYDFLQKNDLDKLTPEEFAQRTKAFQEISSQVDEVSKGLALRKTSGRPSKMALDFDKIKKTVGEDGSYTLFRKVGKGSQETKIGKAQLTKLQKIAKEAEEVGYEVIHQPGKANVYSPVTGEFVDEGFTRVRKGNFEAPMKEIKPTGLGKFVTGAGQTEADLYAKVQANVVKNVTKAAQGNSDTMRKVLASMESYIKGSKESAYAAKNMPLLKELTLKEGLSGASRFMDIPNRILDEIGKAHGINNLAYAVKSSYILDKSLMGIPNIGTWLRSKSSIVDWMARTKQFLKYEINPMFHAQQRIENFFIKGIMGKSDDEVIDFFNDSFREYAESVAKKGESVNFGKLSKSIEDPHFIAKSYDVSLVAQTGKKFMIDDIDKLVQGTRWKNWEAMRKDLEIFMKDNKDAILRHAKDRGLSMSDAILDVARSKNAEDIIQPAIAIMNEAAYNGERIVRGMVQMSFIRGGLERSANYVFFPTSYVVRMTKTLASIAQRPIYGQAFKAVETAKEQSKRFIQDHYGVDAKLMPDTMWAIEQFVPIGITGLGASIDPLTRWVLANIGLGDYIAKPSDLKKSYIPVYREYKDAEAAFGEIRKVMAGKGVTEDSQKGIKVLMDKATYGDVVKPIPFKIQPYEAKPVPIKKSPTKNSSISPSSSDAEKMRKAREEADKLLKIK
jgi:hypothetical protein